MTRTSVGMSVKQAFDDASVRAPNFFIVGAPRCGTTAMAAALSAHPSVFIPRVKEPHAFGSDLTDYRDRMDLDEYVRLFAPAGSELAVGEASVWYLRSEIAAEEIHDFDPLARIIIMLRNPVDMMFSLHAQAVRMGLEHIKNFGTAIDAESDREVGRQIQRTVRHPGPLRYTEAASFSPQVARYLQAFGSDSVHVLLLEELRVDPQPRLASLQRFLGVPASSDLSFARINQSREVRSPTIQRAVRQPIALGRHVARWVPRRIRAGGGRAAARALDLINVKHRGPAPMSADQRRSLAQRFEPDIQALEGLLDRDLSLWREEAT
jgi:hypothetical protein